MRRLTRGRAATDDEATPQASAASEPVSAAPDDAQQGGGSVPFNGKAPAAQSPDEQRTAVLAEGDETKAATDATAQAAPAATDATAVATPADATPAGRDLPAGVDPAEFDTTPTSARRRRLRRRLRYLRAVREVLLRDLGGFYYEAQRTEDGPEAHRRLLDAKSARLGRLDEEVRELEAHLEEQRPQTTLLRQPGLGGTCPQCGELHGSDARFCSRCGTPLGRRASAPRPASAPATTAGDEPKATTASLWGRPKRPDPAAGDPTVAGPAATVATEPAARPGALFAGGGPKAAGKPDEPAGDKTARDETASDKTASDKTASDKTASDKTASDKTASDDAATDDLSRADGPDKAGAPEASAADEPAPTGSERS